MTLVHGTYESPLKSLFHLRLALALSGKRFGFGRRARR
jgi:hypothetical protein